MLPPDVLPSIGTGKDCDTDQKAEQQVRVDYELQPFS
jgi:hypothetical protein